MDSVRLAKCVEARAVRLDCQTHIPLDVYASFMRAGKRARERSQHTLKIDRTRAGTPVGRRLVINKQDALSRPGIVWSISEFLRDEMNEYTWDQSNSLVLIWTQLPSLVGSTLTLYSLGLNNDSSKKQCSWSLVSIWLRSVVSLREISWSERDQLAGACVLYRQLPSLFLLNFSVPSLWSLFNAIILLPPRKSVLSLLAAAEQGKNVEKNGKMYKLLFLLFRPV